MNRLLKRLLLLIFFFNVECSDNVKGITQLLSNVSIKSPQYFYISHLKCFCQPEDVKNKQHHSQKLLIFFILKCCLLKKQLPISNNKISFSFFIQETYKTDESTKDFVTLLPRICTISHQLHFVLSMNILALLGFSFNNANDYLFYYFIIIVYYYAHLIQKCLQRINP